MLDPEINKNPTMSKPTKVIIGIGIIILLALLFIGLSDDENTCVGFNCRSSPNSLNANPAGVTCQADPCLVRECCTVEPVAASCIRPTDTAYNFSSAQETLTINGFGVTDITCNTGYGPGNNIVATVCDSTNTSYTLTGCTEMTCSGDELNCGSGATCSDGDAGDGYTCTCDAG